MSWNTKAVRLQAGPMKSEQAEAPTIYSGVFPVVRTILLFGISPAEGDEYRILVTGIHMTHEIALAPGIEIYDIS